MLRFLRKDRWIAMAFRVVLIPISFGFNTHLDEP
jgi:hypothetical protein